MLTAFFSVLYTANELRTKYLPLTLCVATSLIAVFIATARCAALIASQLQSAQLHHVCISFCVLLKTEDRN